MNPFIKTIICRSLICKKNYGTVYHDVIIPDFIIQEEAKENYDVADFDNDEEEMLGTVRNTIIDDALMYNWVFTLLVFTTKEVALMSSNTF